ncbi:unnamed protein product [Larinioides sclopetarius]|uniref:Uncharacterized protein n=1 Tax=Larinioides sclopetarius TaxID=280406 RepID=A0AAV1ZYG4_9ARAC
MCHLQQLHKRIFPQRMHQGHGFWIYYGVVCPLSGNSVSVFSRRDTTQHCRILSKG